MPLTPKKRIEGHYDVQVVPFGTVYTWHPTSKAALERDADHEANASEIPSTQRLADEVLHPWR